MAPKMITLTVDNQTVTVPEGTLVVDAARRLGVDIPVFCYHPKMEPVGMCRMCLVEIGRPVMDRTSGKAVLEASGAVKIQFGPKLETACTTPVSQDMAVITTSEKVKSARKDVLEFLLTSHPLDCPICDKGGECPLQNLTLKHGPARSRFLFDDKMHLQKHVPLGELIYLDRERCIQCGRCVRFMHQVVEDPVINFYQRGRSLQIITDSEPGFDSIFSGNTTDICPVGALTTADFRFGARPWEMKPAASICNHCPVGCNITFETRREAASGGKILIKRALPRQNEGVNEIWICDKGRFGYHFAESSLRLTQPLIRQGNDLKPAAWEEALALAAQRMAEAGAGLTTLVGGRLSNEDLFNLNQITTAQNGKALLYSHTGGGDLVGKLGMTPGSNLGQLGKGSAILVVAADLHEEAPLWWLRVKQAARRGAALIVLNPRHTRLDDDATYALRYHYGRELNMLSAFLPGRATPESDALRSAVGTFQAAENTVIFFGGEGMDLQGSSALAALCAQILVRSGHAGQVNSGLIGVWESGNTQGAWDMGFTPSPDLEKDLAQAKVAWIAAADPAGDDLALAQALEKAGFVIVQELFMTETARRADIVFPAAAWTEREGSYTSGERRVQRFYPVERPQSNARPDFAIAGSIGEKLNTKVDSLHAALVFNQISQSQLDYAGLNYSSLAQVTPQWPDVGRQDLYYGGSTYNNLQGLGVQLANAAQRGEPIDLPDVPQNPPASISEDGLWVVPITRLYDRGSLISHSQLLKGRLGKAILWLSPQTSKVLNLPEGSLAQVYLKGAAVVVEILIDRSLQPGVGLIPRSIGLPVSTPFATRLYPAAPAQQAEEVQA